MAAEPTPVCVVCRRTAQSTINLCAECEELFSNNGVLDLTRHELVEQVARRAWDFAQASLDVVRPAGYQPGDPGRSRFRSRLRKR